MNSTPANWRKSSRSHQVSNCVEVGKVDSGAAVRDTKNRAAGYITTDDDQWTAFLLAIKTGRYER
ncbi:DUF397 domain-containing protein [Saccharopolyspora sp. NFXS83]|uniref:DUF397 domain-containing protein n=1 Tax=Saccharopolyspora sp. NFXS83 TaxID=2993560 RepID=UPI00224AD1BF|nr:DUF397 domain-containing protein [Saccharopolyspora sp. NFXS83]MCX2728695.1 DUF397 domain-containing protein [Saccharopolyspora sp. NFXS83]